MLFDYIIYLFLFSAFLIWIYFFITNILYFLIKKEEKSDVLFSSRNKSFENVLKKFELLEQIIKKDLGHYKKQIYSYQKNSIKTKRKYHQFSHLIEPALLNIYVSGFVDLSKSKKTKSLFKKLDLLFQQFFTFLCYSIFSFVVVAIVYSFFHNYSTLGIVLIATLPLSFAASLILIFLNVFLLNLVIQILLYVLKKDNGAINRNFSIFSKMFTGFSSNRGDGSVYVIGGAGVSMMSSGSFSGGGGSSFGGFGGGSFGGGGAGGSW